MSGRCVVLNNGIGAACLLVITGLWCIEIVVRHSTQVSNDYGSKLVQDQFSTRMYKYTQQKYMYRLVNFQCVTLICAKIISDANIYSYKQQAGKRIT